MEVNDQTHTLTINKVSLDDAKVFTARAKNPAGQVSCNARLKIVRKYSPPTQATVVSLVCAISDVEKLLILGYSIAFKSFINI